MVSRLPYSVRILSLIVLFGAVLTSPAHASVNYDDHTLYYPGGNWNGYKVYLSPGHFSYDPHTWVCGTYSGSESEWSTGWAMGYDARNELLDRGYRVMMPKKGEDVSYTDRVDTAYDYKLAYPNFAYVTLHSNAAGSHTSCGYSGGNHGGTQILTHNGGDHNVAIKIYNYIKTLSPGSVHETEVDDVCDTASHTELCSTKALDMPTAYMEYEYHDTTTGANWLVTNSAQAGYYTAQGLDCWMAEVSC